MSFKDVHKGKGDHARRVRWLVENLWQGNSSAMAREIGMSHATIGRVVRGEQPPGRKLLTAIADRPKVNPAWLLSGEGQPLLSDPAGLPIARCLLPGSPEEHRDLLSGEHYPVAKAFDRPSRYFYQVPANHPIVISGPKITADDLLLLETDPALCCDLDYAADDRVCVIRDPESQGGRLVLAELMFSSGGEDEPRELRAELYHVRQPSPPPAPRVQERVIGSIGDQWDVFARPRKQESIRQRKRRPPETDRGVRYPTPADIVAVCVQLIRR